MKFDWVAALLHRPGIAFVVALVMVLRDVLTGNFEGADE